MRYTLSTRWAHYHLRGGVNHGLHSNSNLQHTGNRASFNIERCRRERAYAYNFNPIFKWVAEPPTFHLHAKIYAPAAVLVISVPAEFYDRGTFMCALTFIQSRPWAIYSELCAISVIDIALFYTCAIERNVRPRYIGPRHIAATFWFQCDKGQLAKSEH